MATPFRELAIEVKGFRPARQEVSPEGIIASHTGKKMCCARRDGPAAKEDVMATDVDELTPAMRDAYTLLRSKMLNCLDTLDEVLVPANFYDEKVVLALAYNEVPRLVVALRGVLKDHKTDDDGHCGSCGHRKVGERFEPTPWPCAVVNSVYRYVQDPNRFFQYCPDRDGFYA
jgi:hypothetical protein